MADLRTYILIRFSKKSGKIDTTLEALGNAMMRLWALQNTTPTKTCIIFDKITGEIAYYVEGKKDGFPAVLDQNLGNIEDCCPGLLKALNEN